MEGVRISGGSTGGVAQLEDSGGEREGPAPEAAFDRCDVITIDSYSYHRASSYSYDLFLSKISIRSAFAGVPLAVFVPPCLRLTSPSSSPATAPSTGSCSLD